MKFLKSSIAILALALAGAGVYGIASSTGTKLNYNQLPATIPISVTINLDSAQIVNLFSTPILLVDTPGTGYVINPLSISMNYYGSGKTPYDVSSGGDMQIGQGGWNDLFNTFVLTSFSSLITNSDNEYIFKNSITGASSVSAPIDSLNNKPLYLSQIGAGEYATGNAPVIITVQYCKVKVSQ